VLTRVVINNFRALKSVDLPLAPLTVLVGPNASGKSSILRALDPQPPHARDLWRHQKVEASVHWWTTESSYTVGWRGSSGTWHNRGYAYQLLRLDLARLREPNELAMQRVLRIDGTGLTNLHYSLPSRKVKDALARRFCELVPVFSDVDTQPHGKGSHSLKFQDRWDESLWYRPEEVSDGTMLTLAFLLIEFQDPKPTLLCVEEPERGLHPYLLQQLIRVFRQLNTGGMQVVLATHSAELLNYVKPEEVRFLTKDPSDGSVKVEQVSTEDEGWEEAWSTHQKSLGSVWLSGGLGGVPGI